jgi:hypothetical protein
MARTTSDGHGSEGVVHVGIPHMDARDRSSVPKPWEADEPVLSD